MLAFLPAHAVSEEKALSQKPADPYWYTISLFEYGCFVLLGCAHIDISGASSPVFSEPSKGPPQALWIS